MMLQSILVVILVVLMGLTLRGNTTYKPQIALQSYCQPTFFAMECTCVVKGNPPPFVIWRLVNSNITKTEEGYDISTSVSDYITKSLLKGPASAMTSVSCYAENKEGADELLLHIYTDNTKYLVIAGGVGIGALALAVVTLKLLLGGRKNTGEKAKSNDCRPTKNEYQCQPHFINENIECSAHEGSELKMVYGNIEDSAYGNTEFAIKDEDNKEKHSMEPNDVYAVYDCPSFEEEPGSFEEELDSFEEESIYANT